MEQASSGQSSRSRGPGRPAASPPSRVPLSEEERKAQEAAPTELAIGVPGGFDPTRKDFKLDKRWDLAVVVDQARPARTHTAACSPPAADC